MEPQIHARFHATTVGALLLACLLVGLVMLSTVFLDSSRPGVYMATLILPSNARREVDVLVEADPEHSHAFFRVTRTSVSTVANICSKLSAYRTPAAWHFLPTPIPALKRPDFLDSCPQVVDQADETPPDIATLLEYAQQVASIASAATRVKGSMVH